MKKGMLEYSLYGLHIYLSRLKLLTPVLLNMIFAGLVYAQGGRIDIEILGHYTDDKETSGEEWTFEIQAQDSPNLDEKGWRPEVSIATVNMWSGDSNPNNNDWHDLEDKLLFRQVYTETLPASISVRQRGWENDRGLRWVYDCCHWYTNDDDDYGTKTGVINVESLVHETWLDYDWPDLDGDHGIKLRARVIHAPVIKDISPDFGCRGNTNTVVTITGQNFPALNENLLVSIDREGLIVSNFQLVSSSEITARVDILPQACLGFADVKVFNRQALQLPAIVEDGFEIRRAIDPGCATN